MAGYSYSKYSDELAQKKRRRFFLKLYSALVIALVSVSSLTYLLFISSLMKISDVSINGLKTVESSQIFSMIDEIKNREYLWKANLKIQSNILFFDEESLHDKVLAKFPVIKTVELIKEFPHKLTANITERTPMGTWCFTDVCKYFDDSGVLWGKALRSYGSLLITVDDLRPTVEGGSAEVSRPNVRSTDSNNDISIFFEPIKMAIAGLEKIKINMRRIEIPTDSLGDFKVYTATGYYIIFSSEADISKQLEVLRIFLKEKGDNFQAEYIDLRIEGRVYYK